MSARRRPQLRIAVALFLLAACAFSSAPAAERPRVGALVIAHGGDANWNAHVKAAVERVRGTLPAEAAFLMGVPDQRAQQAYDNLVAAGAERVVLVPLFISSRSDHYEQARFIGGQRPDYPHAEHMKLTAVQGPASVVDVRPAMDDHPLVAAIVADRVRALSNDPLRESLVIVAHGPNEDAEARFWNDTIARVGARVRESTGVKEFEVRLLRDDAPQPVKDRALAELRASVEEKGRTGRVIVVPLLMAPGRVADQIPRVLGGLPFAWDGRTLLPDDRVGDWILAQASAAATPADDAGLGRDESVRFDEQLVVTATRTEQPLSEAPVHTEVIDRRTLAATGASSLVEALPHRPGIDLVPTLAGQSVQLQGVSGRGVLLLIDGQEVVGKVNGEVDLGNVLLADVERIEIVKGAGSALYGSDALGGVINVLTRSASLPFFLSADHRSGSIGTQDSAASAGLRSGRWSTLLSGSRSAREGYDLAPAEPTTTGSAQRKVALTGKVGYQLDASTELTVSSRYYDEEASDVTTSRGTVFDDLTFDRRWQTLADLRTRLAATGALAVRAHLTRYSHRFDRVSRASGALTPDLTREGLMELETQYDQALGRRHLVSLGAELERTGMRSDRIQGGERAATTAVLFAQDQWFLHERLQLVAGIRYDHNSDFGAAVSPKVALKGSLTPWLRLRAAYGEGFKAPEFKDLYFSFGNRAAGYQVLGNPDLQPESSRSFTAGLEAEAWRQRLHLSLHAFHHRIDGLIGSVFAGRDPATGVTTFRSENMGAARTRGLEADALFAPAPALAFGFGYALLDAVDERTGEPLTLRSRHSLKGRLLLRSRRTGTGGAVFARFLGRRAFADLDLDGGIDEWAPGVLVWDARLTQDLGRRVQLVLGAENVTGERDLRYFPNPGRRLYAGLALKYERP